MLLRSFWTKQLLESEIINIFLSVKALSIKHIFRLPDLCSVFQTNVAAIKVAVDIRYCSKVHPLSGR